jgi:diguanylate cyclase (GGDEF)-like protein
VAIGLLHEEGGKALDPRVVQAFVDNYPRLAAEADAAAAKTAVGLVSESASRTNVFQDIALAHREIYALYEIAQAMGSSLGVTDTMTLISSKLGNIVPFSCCALFLYNDEADTLRCRFATGVESEVIQQLAIPSGQGLNGWVARNLRPLVNAWPSADLEAAGYPSETSLRCALVCPLVFNKRFIGTISVYHTEPAIYTDDHRRLLDRISEQGAAVIYNSIIFEQAQEHSLTDPLTELPNTRFMFMHLTREFERAERLKSEVAILVLDLDNFKKINDTYGFFVADGVLRAVAEILRAGIRPFDVCVRWFSDKFIVVLSECGAVEAEQKRIELQAAITNMPGLVSIEGRPIRISAGAAMFPHDGDDWSVVITAEHRMHRDKARGRQQSP